MRDTNEFKEFIRQYKRVKHNAVFFLELYYNKVHPDKPLELTDEEKQELFDEYKSVPLFDMDKEGTEKFRRYNNEVERLKAEGYKDWEIY